MLALLISLKHFVLFRRKCILSHKVGIEKVGSPLRARKCFYSCLLPPQSLRLSISSKHRTLPALSCWRHLPTVCGKRTVQFSTTRPARINMASKTIELQLRPRGMALNPSIEVRADASSSRQSDQIAPRHSDDRLECQHIRVVCGAGQKNTILNPSASHHER